MIKTFLVSLVLFATTLGFFAPLTTMSALAYDPTAGTCDGLSAEQKAANPLCTATNNDPITGPNGIIIDVANLIAWFAGAIAVIMIIFAGFRIVKSSGDSGKITQARETIIYALIGLVVIVFARIIVSLVISKL